MLRMLVFLAASALCSAAQAQVQAFTNTAVFDNDLSGVALNAASGTRTLTKTLYRAGVQQPAYSKARLIVAYTWAAATTVTVAFSCALDGTNYGQVMTRSIAGGTATVSSLTDSYTTGGASATLMLEYDIRGCKSAKWLFGGAGAGGSDLITVDTALVAGR